jgi:transposase
LQQIVFQEYLDEIEHSQACLVKLENEMQRALESSPMKPVVEGLMALRGVDFITALSVIAELGDITRFATAGQLMAYLGLTPSEYSSGGKRRQGGISKTGNSIARRYLVESAWSYRFPARKTLHIQRRAKHAPQRIQAIAWEAQKRLCGRYRHLNARGKTPQQTCVAVARELAGFIWAIACEMKMDRKSDHARG